MNNTLATLETALTGAVREGMERYKQTISDKIEDVNARLTGIQSERKTVNQQAIDSATEKLTDFFKGFVDQAVVDLEGTVDARVEKVAPRVHYIEVKQVDGTTSTTEAVQHPMLQEVLDILAIGEIPLLVGPAGCGKTVLAKQVSEVLGVDYAGLSCSGGLTESKVFGRSVPNIHTGKEVYQPTAFVNVYENGGVFLFDEFDAADDNMMVSLNQAFDNGHCMLPERKGNEEAVRHADCHIILTANTYGSGADRQYCSRNQMDAATLNRFVAIDVDYSQEIELSVCPDVALCEMFWGFRNAIREYNLERLCSTRDIRRAYKMKNVGWTMDRIKSKFFAGWSYDDIVAVNGEALTDGDV